MICGWSYNKDGPLTLTVQENAFGWQNKIKTTNAPLAMYVFKYMYEIVTGPEYKLKENFYYPATIDYLEWLGWKDV